LHAAVVELVALDGAEIKYSTVQNWYPGNKEEKVGLQFCNQKEVCVKPNFFTSRNRICCDLEISFMYPKETIRWENFIL
jgi:Fe-S cluster assembly protein SufB